MQEVLLPTKALPTTAVIRGHDFNNGADFSDIMSAMITSGFQATALGLAVEEINSMVRWASSAPAFQSPLAGRSYYLSKVSDVLGFSIIFIIIAVTSAVWNFRISPAGLLLHAAVVAVVRRTNHGADT